MAFPLPWAHGEVVEGEPAAVAAVKGHAEGAYVGIFRSNPSEGNEFMLRGVTDCFGAAAALPPRSKDQVVLPFSVVTS